MADTNLDIKIRTTADTAGAAAAAASLKGVEQVCKGGASATQAQAKAANELGENFEKGAAAGRVLSEVSRGNVMALGQLGAALKTIGVLLKTNLIGALLTLGAVAAQVVLPFVAGFLNKKKAVEDATAAVEASTKAVKELGEQRLKTLQEALALINQTAEQTVQDLTDALDSAEQLADAQDRLALAKIDDDTGLSDSQKITARAAIADRAAERRSGAAIQLAEGVVGARRTAAQGASALESEAAGRYNVASNRVDAGAAYRKNLEGQLPTLRGQMESASQGALGFNEPAYLAAAGRMDDLKAKIGLLDSPDAQTRAASINADLVEATKALDEANKAALKSADELAESERKLAKVRADQAAVAPVEKEIRDIQTGTQVKAAKTKEAAAANAAQIANERELATADAQNLGSKIRAKLDRLPAGTIDPQEIERARAKAEAMASGESSSGEGEDLAAALGPLLLAIGNIKTHGAAIESTQYGKILALVREHTRRLQQIEAREKNARTQ